MRARDEGEPADDGDTSDGDGDDGDESSEFKQYYCVSPAQKRRFFSGTLMSSVSSCAPDGSRKMSWPEPPSPCMRTSSSSVRLLRTKSHDRTCFCAVGLK